MKKDRRKKDIKSKLMAAIAMLMVSSIMVVSSSYAWFTLSTAPEVTGISTAIGANGNLEMALLPTGSTIAEALGKVGNAQGGQSTAEKNTTWGNLVDLSDSSYGLNQITLYPSQLAVTEGTEGVSTDRIADYFLGTPQYGSDGRFSGIATSSVAKIYSGGGFGTSGFGVRAVGTSSGMSDHELAYREVLSTANDAFNKAINQTKAAASTGGSALASLAVAKATGTTTFTNEDVAKLVTTYAAMDTALGHIEVALKQYIIAYALSHLTTGTDYLTTLNTMQGMDLDKMGTYTTGTPMAAALSDFNTVSSTVTTSLAALEKMTGTSYAWDDISAYVTALANVDLMLLNGKEIDYYMANNYEHISDLTSNMSNLVLEVNAGGGTDSGIYVQMANFVDNYTTPVTISGVEYSGISVNNLEATMKVYKASSVATAYLTASKTAAVTYDANAFGTGGGSSISDFYGYIIDMAFRTNAADSSLQLQTDAVDRIYDNNPNTDGYTMGGGSNMEYTVAANSNFSVEKMATLMSYIRVVFFDPTTMEILGYARLDASEDQYNVTYVDTAATPNYNMGYTISMDLKMWNPNVNDGDGAWASSSTITPLVQNTAKAVSTLVYLDGEKLTNADIANVTMTGTMNIQFSSSAELVPMEYGDLMNGNGSEEATEYTVSVNGIEVTDATVEAGASYTLDITSLIPEGKEVTAVTVKMGGQTVENAYNSGTKTISVANVNGNIEVNVTLADTAGTTTTPTTGN